MPCDVRNLELEAQIARDLERDEPYRVYSDWLQQQGHPLGELIALQLGADDDPARYATAEAATRAYVASLAPSWADESLVIQIGTRPAPGAAGGAALRRKTLVWRRGLLRKARLMIKDEPLADALALLEDPAGIVLGELALGFCELPALARLAVLPALRRLSLQQVSLPSPLQLDELPALEALSLLSIQGPLHLAGGAKLRQLAVSNSILPDLAPLAAMRALQVLELYVLGDSLPAPDDLAPLSSLTALSSLSLAGNNLTSIAPLARLAALVSLDLGAGDDRVNAITDLAPLAKLKRLEVLVLDHNPVRDLAPLAALGKLRELHLSHTAVSDLGPLQRLRKLELLSLEQTDVAEEQIAALQKALPELEIITGAADELDELAELQQLQALLSSPGLQGAAGRDASLDALEDVAAPAQPSRAAPSLDDALAALVDELVSSGQLELAQPDPAPLVLELLEAAQDAETDAKLFEQVNNALLDSERVEELYCTDEELVRLLGRCLGVG